MPKLVDHQERKKEILNAFFIYAAREGLSSVTLRGVASQANVSLRQVQYYFGTKDALVMAGLHSLEQQSYHGIEKRLSQSASVKSAVCALVAIFEESLPNDSQSRKFHQLWMSYAMLSLTQGNLCDGTLIEGPNRLQSYFIQILREGMDKGELNPKLHVANESVTLLALINGLGTSILIGQQTVEMAKRSFESYIDKLRKK